MESDEVTVNLALRRRSARRDIRLGTSGAIPFGAQIIILTHSDATMVSPSQ